VEESQEIPLTQTIVIAAPFAEWSYVHQKNTKGGNMPTKQPEVKIRKSKNPITGVINVTGEPDSGKTWFALSSGAAPERTAFIDDDVKGKAIVDMVEAEGRHFAYYKNLVREGKGMRELDFHKLCIATLDEVSELKGQIDVLVWDTWTRFENTFHPAVISNPNKFRQFYSPMGQIKGAEQWNASFEYEDIVIDNLTEVAPLVILTSHLKKDASKREISEGKKPLIRKARMRVFLRHSPDNPAPTGLLLKRLSKAELSNGMRPINVTHRKVFPFTWENLLYYWNNPVGEAKPGPNEQLNEFELSILDGILTKDQKDILRLAVIEAEREREEEERQARLQKKVIQGSGGKNGSSIPTTPILLLTRAMADYKMDGEDIAKVLGISEDELLEGGYSVEDAWEKIKEHANS
jgi:hypothetical protein